MPYQCLRLKAEEVSYVYSYNWEAYCMLAGIGAIYSGATIYFYT